MVFNFLLCIQLSFKIWLLKYLCKSYFHVNSCKREEQGSLHKFKMVYFDKLQFVKLLPTRCTLHSSGNLQSSMTGWVTSMTLTQDDALNKIEKYFPSKNTND